MEQRILFNTISPICAGDIMQNLHVKQKKKENNSQQRHLQFKSQNFLNKNIPNTHRIINKPNNIFSNEETKKKKNQSHSKTNIIKYAKQSNGGTLTQNETNVDFVLKCETLPSKGTMLPYKKKPRRNKNANINKNNCEKVQNDINVNNKDINKQKVKIEFKNENFTSHLNQSQEISNGNNSPDHINNNCEFIFENEIESIINAKSKHSLSHNDLQNEDIFSMSKNKVSSLPDSYITFPKQELANMHHDSNSYNKESEENFCEGVIDENYKLNEVYSQKPMITYHDLEILADGKLEKYCEAYNKFLYKILFTKKEDEKDERNNNGIEPISEIDSDLRFIRETKEKMKNIQEFYENEIKRLEYDIKRQNKTIELRENENEDTEKEREKENYYKATIISLMKELRILTQDNVDAELMKEVNEFLEHNELSENQIKENTNNAIGIMRTRTKQVKLIDRTKPPTTETDLLVELENFKKEEKIYKFEIPLKYQMSKFEKCIKERKIKGRLVKFYENSVIDIINKNKTVKRIFPDGYELWTYNNKDVQQKFPNGRIDFYYHRNKSCEFRDLNKGYLVYKFTSGQYEKHYFDNSKNIKFTDGSYRIIKPNGEELIQYPNGKIIIQDKGVIYKTIQ